MRLAKALKYIIPSLALAAGACAIGAVVETAVAPAAVAAEKQAITNPKLGKPLKEVQELIQKKKFTEARETLKEAQAVPGKTPYETFVVNQFLGYISVNLKDYSTAAQAFETMFETGQTPAADRIQAEKTLVQLNYQIKNYPKVIKYADRYLKENPSDVEMHLMMAQTYYLQSNYKEAASAADDAIKLADQSGKAPKKEWLDLLMSAQYKSGDKAAVSRTLELLVTKYPSKDYWRDLLGGLQGRSGLSDRENFEIYRLKMVTGSLEGATEYVEMAQLALQLGLPGDAKTVVDKGFASGLLGGGGDKDRQVRLQRMAGTQADSDQKSLPSVEKEAAKKPTGDALVKLAEAYSSYAQYDKAIDLYKKGIAKGGLKDQDLTQLDMGITYYKAKQPAAAKAAFKAVGKSSKYGRLASLWAIQTDNGN